jgi:hypothetical protein
MTKRDDEDEARAALKRLDQQAEKIITGSHPDTDPEDRIEILGMRIAKAISVILAVVLIIYLWRTYFAG